MTLCRTALVAQQFASALFPEVNRPPLRVAAKGVRQRGSALRAVAVCVEGLIKARRMADGDRFFELFVATVNRTFAHGATLHADQVIPPVVIPVHAGIPVPAVIPHGSSVARAILAGGDALRLPVDPVIATRRMCDGLGG